MSSASPREPEAVQVPDEIGVDPSDVVLARHHGVGPMTGTQLDPMLRNGGMDGSPTLGPFNGQVSASAMKSVTISPLQRRWRLLAFSVPPKPSHPRT